MGEELVWRVSCRECLTLGRCVSSTSRQSSCRRSMLSGSQRSAAPAGFIASPGRRVTDTVSVDEKARDLWMRPGPAAVHSLTIRRRQSWTDGCQRIRTTCRSLSSNNSTGPARRENGSSHQDPSDAGGDAAIEVHGNDAVFRSRLARNKPRPFQTFLALGVTRVSFSLLKHHTDCQLTSACTTESDMSVCAPALLIVSCGLAGSQSDVKWTIV